jgi:hypothetical protein
VSYLLVGGLLVALIYWGGGRGRILKRPEWRVASGFLALGVFMAASFVGVRGGWGKALLLAALGIALAIMARWPRPTPRAAGPEPRAMSLDEARALLGVADDASSAEVQAAYVRLMRRVHPDHGGAPGLALQVNLARERLLRG